MHVLAVVALFAVALAPFAILWRCDWRRTAIGLGGIAVMIGVAAVIGFVIVDDSPTCDDVCEELYPLLLGAEAALALDLAAWLLALVAATHRHLTRR